MQYMFTTWMVDLSGKLEGKYASTMDPMGYGDLFPTW